MMILMQGSIFLEGLVPLLPSVYALIKLLLHARFHMFYVAWTKVVIIDEIVNHPSVTMFLGWLQVRPCIWSLKYCDHIIPNQRSVYIEQVGECSNRFRVTSRHRSPTENHSTIYHLPIMCEIPATIVTVHGITCGGWRLQIIPQSITEGLSI